MNYMFILDPIQKHDDNATITTCVNFCVCNLSAGYLHDPAYVIMLDHSVLDRLTQTLDHPRHATFTQ